MESDSIFKDIGLRLKRVGEKTAEKWKDVIHGFAEGFISGFISNIITTLINLFATTFQRTVRMIREGALSLLKAIKMMLFPAAHMTKQEAAHEALKLIAAGGILVGGIVLEEVIEKMLIGIPYAPVLTAILVGSLTAISMSLLGYLIDKTDLFDVFRNAKISFVSEQLNNRISMKLDHFNELIIDADALLSLAY